METETPAINQHLQDSIDALLHKTTAPGQMGLKSSDRPRYGDKRPVTVECEKHGTQEMEETFLVSSWTIARCEKCEADKENERKRQEELEKIENARRLEQSRLSWARSNLEMRMQRASIPLRFDSKNLQNYSPPNAQSKKIHQTCIEYVKGFSENHKDGRCLILSGTAGTGKTHLACGIVREVVETTAFDAIYITAGRLFRRVKDTYNKNSKEDESDAISALARPDLLVVDEVGTTFGSDTERNIFFEIINERYERMRPTVIISNLSPENLMEFAGERVIDRMKENGGKMLKFEWDSQRGRQ